ncbi:metal ABC transporter ATP-binding protein [Arthrobacter sp. ISL-28]|uniref:metal ABC transporter ATP-binding protein n=1 Tax=Arthrobacter sp. ISL-28 TaxID=2819108 RepID=UPI001BEB6938|nr:ATP-binding cassette domain-containing protein [Arthrobacter sp. ISL-28]MBT2519702.1 ATP-binding cassette domain-containing protein [Arthrobacter sp. ISL-28]
MPDASQPPIRTQKLSVSVETGTILHGIDLTVTDGEAVALLGANGSGKSTLIKAMVGIVPITSGSAEIFGADITAARRSVPWSRIGYVPQRLGPSSGVPATAVEVVASGLLHNRRLRTGRATRKKALEALDQVGLADRAHDSVQVFSGGQQQRVLIARALVRDPDLIILDEPLAGIDRASKEALARTLARMRGNGTTVLVVLHELGELAGMLERAVVLRHGRVIFDGLPPSAAPGHDHPDHDHVHAHADTAPPGHTVPDLRSEW